MIQLNNVTTSHAWDTGKKLGRQLLLSSSGDLDGANFVLKGRNRDTDAFFPLTDGTLAAGQHWEHETAVVFNEYQVEVQGATASTDVVVNVNYAQGFDRSTPGRRR